MGTFELIALVVIGLLAGSVGGLLGIGGSIIMIPAMTEVLGPDQHLYQAAAMIVNFFVVVPATWQHHRAKAIDAATVRRIIPMAIVAVIVGVFISELPFFAGAGEVHLRRLFGFFLLLVVGTDLYRLLRGKGESASSPRATAPQSAQATPDREGPDDARDADRLRPLDETSRRAVGGGAIWRSTAAVAIPTGLVAGLLGVGGGIVAVPLQRRFLRVPIRIAIANSATIIIATSFIGAIVKNYAWMQHADLPTSTNRDHPMQSLWLAGVLIPMAIFGSVMGSRLTHRLPLRMVKVAFFLLLLVAGVRLTGVGASL